VLDAAASAGVSTVQLELTGGALNQFVVATVGPTIYGWVANWNSTAASNGTYTLQSIVRNPGGTRGTSAGVTIWSTSMSTETCSTGPKPTFLLERLIALGGKHMCSGWLPP
jgi:hypothetical protein